jgi:hypothetical protein
VTSNDPLAPFVDLQATGTMETIPPCPRDDGSRA